jgi:thioredoxin 1
MDNIVAFNKDNFDEYFDKHDFIVLDFSADWCEPCQSFGTVIEAMATQFPSVVFGTIDVSKEQELASAFSVRSVPTTVIIRYQVAVFVQSGTLSQPEFKRLLSEAAALTVDQVKSEVKNA